MMSDLIFFPLIRYLRQDFVDMIFRRNTLAVSLYLYMQSLVVRENNLDANGMLENEITDLYPYNMKHLGVLLFYYCQAKAEAKEMVVGRRFMQYACCLQELYEKYNSATGLKEYFAKEYELV